MPIRAYGRGMAKWKKAAKVAGRTYLGIATLGTSEVGRRAFKKTTADKATADKAKPRPPGGPDVYRLADFDDIVLKINKKHMADGLARELAGGRPSTESFEDEIQVLMFRDESSDLKNSVRVEMPDGRLVGWVTKAGSEKACLIIDSVDQARPKRSRGSGIRLEVTLYYEGCWSEYMDGDDPDDPEVQDIDFDDFEIQIADPIEATLT